MHKRLNKKEKDLIISLTNPFGFKQYDISLDGINLNNILYKGFQLNVESIMVENLLRFNSLKKSQRHLLDTVNSFLLEKREEATKTLNLLIKLLNAASIEFIVFKSAAPHLYYKDDIDILVSVSDYKKVRAILKEEGFNFSAELKNSVHYDKPGFTQIDLHKTISWGYLGNSGLGPQMLDIKKINNSKINQVFLQNTIHTPNPTQELLVLNAHSIFQHGYLTLGEILFMGELIRTKGADVFKAIADSKKYKWNQLLQSNLLVINSFYKNNWDIDLGIGSALKIDSRINDSTKQKIVFSALKQIYLTANYFYMVENSFFRGFVRFLAYLYRHFYHFIYRDELAFNPVSPKIKNMVFLKDVS